MQPIITSLQNPQIKNLVKLRQRRQRDRQRLMLIDGIRPLSLALRNGFQVDTLYFCQARASPVLLELARAKGVRLQPVDEAVCRKIGYGDNPDGHLGLAAQPVFDLAQLPLQPNPIFLIAEGLEKPGNLGAILRSADAAGITGLLVCDGQTDIYNPNVIRASQGAIFTVSLAVADYQMTVRWLSDNEIAIYAASPEAAQNYTTVDLSGAIALVVGAEAAGLTDRWAEFGAIKIPMQGQVDSLNVAQTATLLMFEAVRQRASN